MTNDQALHLLEQAAEAEPFTVERTLRAAAAFSLAAAGDELIVVGGTANNLHTGSYVPTDIDLVGEIGRSAHERLEKHGFERRGRHWVYTFDDDDRLAFEVVADHLFELATDEPQMIDLGDARIRVISLDDLMMDRLLQATGGESVTRDEATRLAVAAYERIDWEALERRTETAARSPKGAYQMLPEVLKQVRSEARRILRTIRPPD